MTEPLDETTKLKSRRQFLLLLPLGIIAGMLATVATAAFRFLRPALSHAEDEWIDVAPVAELKGNKPIAVQVTRDHVAGWARVRQRHNVYVLPVSDNQILSAICPHEGCEVAWHDDLNIFACPCHDSNFTPEGERIDGPARRGLDPLPARVENGKLQVQYRHYLTGIEERISHG